MTFPATLKWVLLALLGIAVAAAVAITASNLASRQIGLASEPITAGDALAPATGAGGGSGGSHGSSHRPGRDAEPPATATTAPEAEPTTPETTTPPPATQPPREGDDSHGGAGHGGDSGGHGADD